LFFSFHFSTPFLNCGYFVTVLILVNDLIISLLFLFVSEKKAPELGSPGLGQYEEKIFYVVALIY